MHVVAFVPRANRRRSDDTNPKESTSSRSNQNQAGEKTKTRKNKHKLCFRMRAAGRATEHMKTHTTQNQGFVFVAGASRSGIKNAARIENRVIALAPGAGRKGNEQTHSKAMSVFEFVSAAGRIGSEDKVH